MRRWRNLPFRRGSFWEIPVSAAAAPAPPAWVAPPLRQSRRMVPLRRRTQPPAIPPPAPAVPPQQGHDTPRLLKPRRGQFLALPPVPAAAVMPPSWVPPPLRQPRRWLPSRRRPAAAVTAVTAVTAPAGMPRHPARLARVPRGQFFPAPPAPIVAGTPGPLVPPHLHQRRAQPLRIPRSHRADPPWPGAAAAPVLPVVPQFPRQSAARARLPRRGCLFGVPPARAGVPVPMRRRAPGIVPPRRGCVFRVPGAPAGNTSPGPLVVPFLRAAGHRPRWPARPRRGCFFYLAPFIAPPPPFTVGTLTASSLPGSTLTTRGAASMLAAFSAPLGVLTASSAPGAVTTVTVLGLLDEVGSPVLDEASGFILLEDGS